MDTEQDEEGHDYDEVASDDGKLEVSFFVILNAVMIREGC